jgi:septum formation protein
VEELILASSSPRRAELLRSAGYRFRVMAPDLPEPLHRLGYSEPRHKAEALSFFKASEVACRLQAGLVLGADTIVAAGNHVFGKPVDRQDARRILDQLTRSPHEVITGVTLIDAGTGHRRIRHDRTGVYMRPMTDEQMQAYLDSGQWRGKAGAYGVQDAADAFVERIDGSFSNVVGLPMELLARMLAEFAAQPLPRGE